MNRLLALVKREYWENRIAFRATPIALFGIYMAGAIMALVTFNHFDHEFHTLKELVRYIAQTDVEIRDRAMYLANIGTSSLFTVVLAFVVFFLPVGITLR